MAAPKVLKKIPMRKMGVKVSNFALGTYKKSVITISKNQVFGKSVKIIKNTAGEMEKKIETSVPVRAFRRYQIKKEQFIDRKRFDVGIDKVKHKLKLGKEADGQTLYHNMKQFMSEEARKLWALEKKTARWLGHKVGEAHHIVAGNSPTAQKARKILEKCKIDINDPRNVILLPMDKRSALNGTIHGRHISQYDDIVYKKLSEAYSKKGREGVLEALDEIREELIKGDIQLLKKHSFNTILNTFIQ